MIVGTIDVNDSDASVAVLDTQIKKYSKKRTVSSQDIVAVLPALWSNVLRTCSHVYITADVSRFSRSRQLALIANLMSREFGQKLSLHTNPFYSPASLAQKIITASWNKVVAPIYSAKPNITKRKKI